MPTQISRPDLILHPLRLRLLTALAVRPLPAQALATALAAPLPSLYRHLKLLLEGGLLEIAETRPVRGAMEKTYRLKAAPRLEADDLAGLSRAEHQHFFNLYAASLIQGFSAYLTQAPEPLDLLADKVGYTEIAVYASDEELEVFGRQLNAALQTLAANPPDNARRLRKLAVISHPLWDKEIEQNGT